MTSSISLAPSTSQLAQGSPPTLSTTKSSFPEIEKVNTEPRSSTPHSLIPLQLQIHQSTEPFISPLTETNLNYHKSTFSSSRDAKSKYVEAFIHNQRLLLEQELKLQHKTMIEIRSMIPLDTNSIEEELVRDDFQRQLRLSTSSTDYSTQRHRRYSALTYSWFSNNDDNEQVNMTGAFTSDDNDHLSTQQMGCGNNKPQRTIPKRQWTKVFTRWIRFVHDKKPTKNSEEHQIGMETAEPVSSIHTTQDVITPIDSTSQPTQDMQINPTPETRKNNERQARKPTRHVSWSVGTSYEEYKRQKAAMMEQGLYGLSNANIARALGGSQRGSKAPLLFQPEMIVPSCSQENNPLSPTPTPSPCSHITPSEPQTLASTKKKDPGTSFVQQTLSSTKTLLRPRKSTRRKVNNIEPNDTTQTTLNDSNTDLEQDGHAGEGEDRDINAISADRGNPLQQRSGKRNQQRRSTHIMERYSPRLSALEEEDIVGIVGSTLVAFRYPKMVRIKDLRDAAIHILSTPDDNGDDSDTFGDRYSGGGKHKERYEPGLNSYDGCGYKRDILSSRDNNSRLDNV